ncbi:MAG: helix-turn-helix domain-containing protein, partial [Pseudomonadota bacterium]
RILMRAGTSGLAAGEIAAALDVRQNTMSANLAVLRGAGLVRTRREGRSIRYFADTRGVRGLLSYLVEECCGGRPDLCRLLLDDIATAPGSDPMVRPMNVLFLCTGNSARSIMAEAILEEAGEGRFRAFSAGSHPRGAPHPMALDLLALKGHDTGFARSKSWDEFAVPDAPEMDFVFTVCDRAAAETCPVWPGQPISANWGVPDPAAADGNEAERRVAFAETYRMLWNRIKAFRSLPFESLDALALKRAADEIGRTGGEA